MDLDNRHCETCGALLIRKIESRGMPERLEYWKRRRYCDRSCGSKGTGRRVPKGEGIEWAPILVTEPPTEDRCWAGFLAGRRCTLPRNAHVTHLDASGREFVKIERKPAVPFDRNTGATAIVQVSFRNERRPIG